MTATLLAAYIAVSWLNIITPGPAVLLAVRNGTRHGVRSAVCSSLGNVCGLFMLSASAMLGLGAVVASSALLFTVLKIVGAAYLIYPGRH